MEVPGKIAYCGTCKKGQNKSTEADGFCTECDIYMCQVCFNCHLVLKLSMNHVLSPVCGGRKKQTQKRVKLDNCKLHKEEIVKYYCRLHDVIACVDCVVVDHRQCEVEFIRDLVKSVQETSDYKDVLRSIQRLEAEKETCDNQQRQNRNKNTALVDKAVDEIRRFRKELNYYLENAEKEIIDEAQQLSNENEKKMSDLEEKIASITHKIFALTDSLDPKSCPDEILFTRLIECKPQVQQIEKKLSKNKGMIDIKSFTFVPADSLRDILNKRPKIGCLKMDWPPASVKSVPTRTQTGSEISKQEQTNLSQESKAQLENFEKTPIFWTTHKPADRSFSTCYYDPRAHEFNVGTRVYYGRELPGTVTEVYPEGFVDVKLDAGPARRRVAAGAEGCFLVSLLSNTCM